MWYVTWRTCDDTFSLCGEYKSCIAVYLAMRDCELCINATVGRAGGWPSLHYNNRNSDD